MRKIKKYMKVKALPIFILLLLTMLAGYPSNVKADTQTETNTETDADIEETTVDSEHGSMNIYALYLETEEKGESVIVESGGQCLVMDLGLSEGTDTVIKQLKSMGYTHIQLYFSHLHKDHVGGSDSSLLAGLNKLKAAGIYIDTLYMQDPSTVSLSAGYPLKYSLISDFMEDQGEIVYLKAGDHFEVGEAEIDVLGPVDDSSVCPEKYVNETDGSDGDTADPDDVAYTYYENNRCLVSMVSCGGYTFLNTGDALKDEMSKLINYYKELGTPLSCDILKLSHHGKSGGNISGVLSALQPQYSFAQNTGYEGKDSSTGLWLTNSSYRNASKYGMCYYTGNEKATLIYSIDDGNIKLYQDTIEESNQLQGFVKLTGSDGKIRDYDYYYIDESGLPLSGIYEIDGKMYQFTKGGQMIFGDYDSDGNYLGWRVLLYSKRYLNIDSEGRASIATGFQTISGNVYFFTKKGFLLESDGTTPFIKQIGSSMYCFQPDGRLITKRLVEVDGAQYYVNEKGKCVQKQIVSIGGSKYYFGKYGTMIKDRMLTIKGSIYCFDEDGKMLTSTLYQEGRHTYYFGSDGKAAQKCFVKLKGQSYYFGKYATLVTDCIVKYNGKSYYVDSDGIMVKGQSVAYQGKYYYFDSKGAMVKYQFVTENGKQYYYGKYGTRVTNKVISVDGIRYKCSKTGLVTCLDEAA